MWDKFLDFLIWWHDRSWMDLGIVIKWLAITTLATFPMVIWWALWVPELFDMGNPWHWVFSFACAAVVVFLHGYTQRVRAS